MPANPGRQSRLGAVLAAAVLVTLAPLAALGTASAAPGDPVPTYICHDTGTVYTKETTALTGHRNGHRRDIIPPDGTFAGQNWTSVGQAIWANGCVGNPAVIDASAPDKVTICHRTHAVTNPYRRITVASSAVDGAGGNDHTGHVAPLFDPQRVYAPNEKVWGDVIPNAAGGGVDPGLNWTAHGIAIWNGTTQTSAGRQVCAGMTPQRFAQVELGAGIPVPDVIADLLEQGAEGDSTDHQVLTQLVHDVEAATQVTPQASTSPATDVTSNGANLPGTVTFPLPPADEQGSWWILWGPQEALTDDATRTPVQSLTGTGTAQDVSVRLTGLTPSTRYWFRVDGAIGGTEVAGDTLSFTTTGPATEPPAEEPGPDPDPTPSPGPTPTPDPTPTPNPTPTPRPTWSPTPPATRSPLAALRGVAWFDLDRDGRQSGDVNRPGFSGGSVLWFPALSAR